MTDQAPPTITADVVIVGGGVAGSSLGAVLARAGLGVTIVEREAHFRDRVRGESIMPWGVGEADQLGLLPVLRDAGAQVTHYWKTYANRVEVHSFDVTPQTPAKHAIWNIYHPSLQEALLAYAETSGARVLRPARTTGFNNVGHPELTVATEQGSSIIRARLVIGADGRTSAARRWAGVAVIRDPVLFQIGGCLLDDIALDDDSTHSEFGDGWGWLIFPQRDRRARAYIACQGELAQRLTGHANRDQFIPAIARALGDGAFKNTQLAGPVAFYPNANIWAERAAANRVALVGDAAGANDPVIGQGLSLCFLDARELRDLLLDGDNWESAIAEYAKRRAGIF